MSEVTLISYTLNDFSSEIEMESFLHCNLSLKKLYNCKYEKHDKSWFLLCAVFVLECRKIYKKAFKSLSGKTISVGLVNTRQERSSIKT